MNVFFYELKQYKKSLIGWIITFVVLIAIFIQFVPMFLEESEMLSSFFQSLGETYTAAVGIDLNVLFTELGFYAYLFTYLGLMAAIQAMSLGLGIISKENRMKTADFLMAKPRTRTKLFLSKYLAGICCLVITQVFFYLSNYLFMDIVTKGDFNKEIFLLMIFAFGFIQFIFYTLGLFIATIVNKVKSPVTVTIGICFGFFLLGMISSITGNETLIYFVPFRYFDNNYIMLNNAYEMKFLVLSIILPFIFSISSYLVYTKKDVPSV